MPVKSGEGLGIMLINNYESEKANKGGPNVCVSVMQSLKGKKWIRNENLTGVENQSGGNLQKWCEVRNDVEV